MYGVPGIRYNSQSQAPRPPYNVQHVLDLLKDVKVQRVAGINKFKFSA